MDNQKIAAMGYWMKTDSLAEEWYNNAIAITLKVKYADLENSFKTCFPNVAKVKKTGLELERELAGMRIKAEDLGETESYKGQDVYTHIVFTETIINLAKQAKIETTTSGLFNLQDELPDISHKKILENQTNWTSFADTIKKIDMGHI